jgi:predicted GIY-YIG superfamily endonuclease
MGGYVYMLASKKGGTIYIGVTADLSQRVYDHKQRINKKSFTAQYGASGSSGTRNMTTSPMRSSARNR